MICDDVMKRINYDNHVNLERRIFFSCETCGEFRIKKQSIMIGKKLYCSPHCQHMGNIGTTHSEETKIKISKITKEKLSNPITIKKMSLAKLGKKQPTEVILKRTKTMRKIMQTQSYKDAHHKSMLGHSVSPSTREKIAESRRGEKHWTTRLPYTDEHKAKLREKRLHQVFPQKDSKIEVMMQIALFKEGIRFEKHKAILGQPDIFIEPNICIFVDGCWWHGCTQCHGDNILKQKIPASNIVRDQKVNSQLMDEGYRIMRIWEHQILGKKTKIMDVIKSMMGGKF